ncbi:MAG: CRISPR-associated exonuclease Cas4 [Candidatus Methanolliviera sp. GoM_oil]|nr:MAG: CRISPR-associated exonuclease Cas4 [Candidatus Methanolliviera sp. GoM_oil]
MKTDETSIMISDVIEYLFCPRFIYFMYCLDIPQYEEKRYKVLKGRELHETREKVNKNYVRRKLHCIKKESAVYLASPKYHIRGVVDEVLFLEDGTASPLDYKFAEFKDKLFRTHKYQSALYALMIADTYKVKVDRGFICYTRSNNLVKEIEFKEGDFKKAVEMVDEILEIIQKGFYPKGTSYKAKCVDCTYRNICV